MGLICYAVMYLTVYRLLLFLFETRSFYTALTGLQLDNIYQVTLNLQP